MRFERHWLIFALVGVLLISLCGAQEQQQNAEEVVSASGYLGIAVKSVGPELGEQLGLDSDTGLLVLYVTPGGPGAVGGLRKHDVLTMFEDQILVNTSQLRVLVANAGEGAKCDLAGKRGGEDVTSSVILDARPAGLGAAAVPGVNGVPRDHAAGDGETGPAELKGVMKQIAGLRANGKAVLPPEAMAELREQLKGVIAERRHGGGAGQPGAHATMVGMGGAGGNVTTFTMSRGGGATSSVTKTDGDHTLTLSTRDGVSTLLAKDKEGNVLFKGPVDTDEQLDKVPAEIREKAERMRGATSVPAMRIFQTPTVDNAPEQL
ncbi:MAG: PDZ domain-containing protein [Lentisphaeria bacterium]|nr:PDZ domain-containing protein [Lentisphaeria bacterium]